MEEALPESRDGCSDKGGLALLLLLALAKAALEQTSKREVFIQIGPMEAVRRHFDAVELCRGAFRKAGILAYGKPNFHTAFHLDHNMAVSMDKTGGNRRVNTNGQSEGGNCYRYFCAKNYY